MKGLLEIGQTSIRNEPLALQDKNNNFHQTDLSLLHSYCGINVLTKTTERFSYRSRISAS